MSEQLEYISETYNRLKELQEMNANFFAAASVSAREFTKLEINPALHAARVIDQTLATELEQVGKAYERTKAELEAAQPVADESAEDSFDDFIARCVAHLQDRSDLVADGSAITLSFTQQGPEGTRQFVTTFQDGYIESTTRTESA